MNFSKKQLQVSEQIRREIGLIIIQEVDTRNLGSLIHVMRVQISADLSIAKVFFRIEKRFKDQALLLLNQSLKQIEHALLKKLNMNKKVSIQFIYDDTADQIEEIQSTLSMLQIEQEIEEKFEENNDEDSNNNDNQNE